MLIGVGTAAFGAGSVAAQGEKPAIVTKRNTTRTGESPDRIARRLARMLELPDKRHEAINGLLRLGSDSVPALVATLNDPRPEIVIIALTTIGTLGGLAESALPSLDKLASGEDKPIATAASWAMHKMRPIGITLIAEYDSNLITRIDAAGKATKLEGLNGPFDVELLPNDNYLVVEYGANRVCELDAKGKLVWEYNKLSQPIDADALPNGNILIVERASKQVIEVTRKGDIAWTFKYEGQAPQDADRLANGNTLISYFTEGQVIEVDPSGKVVWKLSGFKMLSDADRLANGNTLLASAEEHLVREVDPMGNTVMKIDIGEMFSDADRLPNGHTPVASNSAVVEFDAKGKECWRRAADFAGGVSRH
jgi:hypothetical protein